MKRWLGSFVVSLLASVGSFVLILWMILPSESKIQNKPVQVGHFVPMSKSSSSQPQSRARAPEPPPDVEQPAPQTPQQTPTRVTPEIKLDIAAPNIASSISLQAQNMPTLDLPAAAAPSAAPAPAMPDGGPDMPMQDSDVMPLNEVLPEYPDMARRRGIEGFVRLGFTISANGRVENVEVLEASPPNIFDRSARRAAVRWRFTPSTENGIAVPRKAVKTIEFKLTQSR